MEEIYYVDRPAVPATQHNIIRLGSILEHAVPINATDIHPGACGDVVEVRNSQGEIEGTLVYFPGLTREELTWSEDEKEVFEGEEVNTATPDDGVAGEESAQDSLDSWNAVEEEGSVDVLSAIQEDRMLNLELELSAAKQLVQDIEDEIADEEGALD